MTEHSDAETALANLISLIPKFAAEHATTTPVWDALNQEAKDLMYALYGEHGPQDSLFGPFGRLIFPFTTMGSIKSPDLFGLDELIIFCYYYKNRTIYRRAADFGANIGLHSFMLSRCGMNVRSFEPDPVHADLFDRTMNLNKISSVVLTRAAVSLEDGRSEFVRVCGNTTGSHLAGSKSAPYGALDRFDVRVSAADRHIQWADLVKIDIEGHEATLICGLPKEVWRATDAFVEVGTAENAQLIFDRLYGSGTNMCSQKIGWARVDSVNDMPTSHRDGSLFITSKDAMHW